MIQRNQKVILYTVSKLLHERGGVEFSLAEIAKHSGKNSALVSYHFGGSGKDQRSVE